MTDLHDILNKSIQILFPLWLANGGINMVCGILSRLRFNLVSIDLKHNFIDKRRIFGDSRTIISIPILLLLGMVGSMIINNDHMLFAGAFVLIGSLITSFIKRRLNIERGKPLPIVDQCDYLIVYLIYSLTMQEQVDLLVIMLSFIINIPIHIFANMLAYLFKLKSVPY